MNEILKPKYKKFYEEDKLFVSQKFISYNIPKKISKLYLDNLLSAYKNIEDINFKSMMDQVTLRIIYMSDGDFLTQRQRYMISNCTQYLISLYNIRVKRGEIIDGSANDKCNK